MNTDRLIFLLDRYLDAGLNQEEKRELEDTLLASAEARRVFGNTLNFTPPSGAGGEEAWGRKLAEQPTAAEIPPERASRGTDRVTLADKLFWWLRLALPMGAAAALVLVLWTENERAPIVKSGNTLTPDQSANTSDSRFTSQPPMIDEGQDPTGEGVAILTAATNAVWLNLAAGMLPGEVLKPGWFQLKSGLVQLLFNDGASLTLNGQTEVRLVSNSKVRIGYGQCAASVPDEGSPFEMESSAFELVGLEGQLQVTVATNGAAAINVFHGRAELHRAGTNKVNQTLGAGRSLTIGETGKYGE